MGNSDGFTRASPQLGSPGKEETMNNSWFQPAPSEVTTFSPQVQVGSFMESKFEFTSEGRALNSRLLKVRHEIQACQTSQDRDEKLQEFIDVILQFLEDCSMDTPKQQATAKRFLLYAVQMLEECKQNSDGNLYSFQFYDIYNNWARIENISGNIEESLVQLRNAEEHTKYFTALTDKNKAEELIQSTVLPELQLNICNTEMCLGKNQDALKSARKSVEQTIVRI